MSDLVATAAESRQRFLDVVSDVRPELHRYCARMTGSVFDGEDVVQDTLAQAWFALAEMDATPPLRPWLFRIAHNASMDFVRRYEYRNLDADADPEMAAGMMAARDRDAHEPDGDLVETALKVFAALSPVQRSALALKDVLGLSLVYALRLSNKLSRHRQERCDSARNIRCRHTCSAELDVLHSLRRIAFPTCGPAPSGASPAHWRRTGVPKGCGVVRSFVGSENWKYEQRGDDLCSFRSRQRGGVRTDSRFWRR